VKDEQVESLCALLRAYLISGRRESPHPLTGEDQNIHFESVTPKQVDDSWCIEILFRELKRPDFQYGYRLPLSSDWRTEYPPEFLASVTAEVIYEWIDSAAKGLPTQAPKGSIVWLP
jgi:hypothetical protein